MKEAFLAVLNMSVTGAAIIAALLVIRILFKNLPRRFAYALWAIPAIRLLCPFSVPSALSAFNLFRPRSVVGNRMSYILPAVPGTLPESAANPAGLADSGTFTGFYSGGLEASEAQAKSFDFIALAAKIWAAAAVLILIWNIISYVRIRLLVKDSEDMGQYYICEKISSPFVFGFIRPKIYLPSGLDSQDTDCVLAHEKSHIRRRDYLVKLLTVPILSLHWFNPLAWLGIRLMTVDMELSCDENALKILSGDRRKIYANALLNVSMKQNGLAASAFLGFGETGVKSRIKEILRTKKPTVFGIAAAVIIITVSAVCFLTNASAGRKDKAPEDFGGYLSYASEEVPDLAGGHNRYADGMTPAEMDGITADSAILARTEADGKSVFLIGYNVRRDSEYDPEALYCSFLSIGVSSGGEYINTLRIPEDILSDPENEAFALKEPLLGEYISAYGMDGGLLIAFNYFETPERCKTLLYRDTENGPEEIEGYLKLYPDESSAGDKLSRGIDLYRGYKVDTKSGTVSDPVTGLSVRIDLKNDINGLPGAHYTVLGGEAFSEAELDVQRTISEAGALGFILGERELCDYCKEFYIKENPDKSPDEIYVNVLSALSDTVYTVSVRDGGWDGEIIEKYTVNLEKGVGETDEGGLVDLRPYIPELRDEFDIPTLTENAESLYRAANGYYGELEISCEEGPDGMITISVEISGSRVESYTVNRYTAIGYDSALSAVDLREAVASELYDLKLSGSGFMNSVADNAAKYYEEMNPGAIAYGYFGGADVYGRPVIDVYDGDMAASYSMITVKNEGEYVTYAFTEKPDIGGEKTDQSLLADAAAKYFMEKSGTKTYPVLSGTTVYPDTLTVEIDSDGGKETYYINMITAKGFDEKLNAFDLSEYISGVSLSQGKINELCNLYMEFERFSEYSTLKCDESKPEEIGGNTYLPVTEPGFDTLEDWKEFLNRVFTPALAEKMYENTASGDAPRYAEKDGKLYAKNVGQTEWNYDRSYAVTWGQQGDEGTVSISRRVLSDKSKADYEVKLKLSQAGGEWLIDEIVGKGRVSENESSEEDIIPESEYRELAEKYVADEGFYYTVGIDTSKEPFYDGEHYPAGNEALDTFEEWEEYKKTIYTDEAVGEIMSGIVMIDGESSGEYYGDVLCDQMTGKIYLPVSDYILNTSEMSFTVTRREDFDVITLTRGYENGDMLCNDLYVRSTENGLRIFAATHCTVTKYGERIGDVYTDLGEYF